MPGLRKHLLSTHCHHAHFEVQKQIMCYIVQFLVRIPHVYFLHHLR